MSPSDSGPAQLLTTAVKTTLFWLYSCDTRKLCCVASKGFGPFPQTGVPAGAQPWSNVLQSTAQCNADILFLAGELRWLPVGLLSQASTRLRGLWRPFCERRAAPMKAPRPESIVFSDIKSGRTVALGLLQSTPNAAGRAHCHDEPKCHAIVGHWRDHQTSPPR